MMTKGDRLFLSYSTFNVWGDCWLWK